jgi:hypothetical protein
MMDAAGMAVTYAGSNADLNDPLGWAVFQLEGSVTDITAVADADLETVASDDERYITDVAELRLLDNILTNLELVDISVGPRSEHYDQLAQRIKGRRDKLRADLESEIGLGAAKLTTGVMRADFAEEVDT